jgi:hypothetical protein
LATAAKQATAGTDKQQEKAKRQKHTRKNNKPKKDITENTKGNAQSVTTCKKRGKKKKNRFLQEYESRNILHT